MVTGVLVVNIHKAAPNVHRAVAGCLSHPKGHRQYDTALTALEKCQKTQDLLCTIHGFTRLKTVMGNQGVLGGVK